eukprot:371785_1
MSDKKHILKSLKPTTTTFLIGCATGAITATSLFLFRKHFSSSSIPQNNKQNSIIIIPQDTKSDEIKEDIKEESKLEHNDDFFNNKTLLNDRVYKRLQAECKPKNTFYCQYVSNNQISLVTAINILVEYLPNSAIKTIFLYLPNQPNNFDVSSFLQNGWKQSPNTLHDYPNIYVENILPIKNQPSLILTIGVPGSGKSTWAKIRTDAKTVIAADDYFDKFNNGKFDVKLLSKAHEWCQKSIFNACKSGQNAVANNTNTTLSEMHAYVTKIIFGNLPHKIVFAVMQEQNIKVLSSRGLHGVPVKKIKEMLRRMNYWLQKGPPSIHSVLRAGAFRRWNNKNVSKDFMYTGIFMDQETQKKIRKYFMNISGECLLCDTTDCHLTLKYLPLINDVENLPFGKRVCLRIIGYAMHKYINCFIVDIMDDEVRRLCSNKYPHISISFNKSHLRPNYSNELLENGKIIPIINNFDVINTRDYNGLYRNVNDVNGGGLVVTGTVGAFCKIQGGGVKLKRPIVAVNDEKGGDENDKGWSKKKKRKRGGRNRNKNKNNDTNKNDDNKNSNE